MKTLAPEFQGVPGFSDDEIANGELAIVLDEDLSPQTLRVLQVFMTRVLVTMRRLIIERSDAARAHGIAHEMGHAPHEACEAQARSVLHATDELTVLLLSALQQAEGWNQAAHQTLAKVMVAVQAWEAFERGRLPRKWQAHVDNLVSRVLPIINAHNTQVENYQAHTSQTRERLIRLRAKWQAAYTKRKQSVQ